MKQDKKRDIEFQIESLKIQLDMGYKLSWFFAIFGTLFSIIIAYPFEFVKTGFPPLLIGLTFLSIALISDWKEKTLSKLKQKYLR